MGNRKETSANSSPILLGEGLGVRVLAGRVGGCSSRRIETQVAGFGTLRYSTRCSPLARWERGGG
jgi:hypothetical protein